MPAPYGTKNAEKWTADVVKKSLQLIEEDAQREDTLYLNAAMTHLRISRRAWSYWRRKFAYDEEIREHMDVIEGIFEMKVVEMGVRGHAPAAITIFMLKNNHRWTDRPQPEVVAESGPHEPELIFELANDEALIIPYKPRK